MVAENAPHYICTGCGILYGKPPKSVNGYCSRCWNVWLAQSALNVALAQVESNREYVAACRARGVKPVRDF